MSSLHDHLERAIALQNCDGDTLEAYWGACRKMFKHCKKPASQWTGTDVEEMCWWLHRENYSRSSRKQFLCGMAFVFKHVLKADMGTLKLPPLPAYRKPLKVVPTQEELREIFRRVRGQVRLALMLMYGGGPRVSETVELRVKDVDLAARSLRIYEGKYDKFRMTVIPECLLPYLVRFIEGRRLLFERDVSQGGGLVGMPHQLGRKWKNAGRELRWQFLFPSAVRRGEYRWHMTTQHVAEELKAAVDAAGIIKHITPHTLRHAFCTHGLQAGNNVKLMQELMGHEDLNTTAMYLHADAASGVSPMDVALPGPGVRRLNIVPFLPPEPVRRLA
jgi:site-specific recombinase XerD